MRRVIVTNNVTLDGVIQAPGRPDEDLRSCWDRGSASSTTNSSFATFRLGKSLSTSTGVVIATYEALAAA